MTMTSYEFYHITGLNFKGAIISLDGALGIQLGLDMLEEVLRWDNLLFWFGVRLHIPPTKD